MRSADPLRNHLTLSLFVDVFSNSDEAVQQLSSSSSTVSCSPRWILYPHWRAKDASHVRSAKTQQQCLEACVADSRCLIIEWNVGGGWETPSCWKHDQRRKRESFSVITQYEIVTRCDPASGTSCQRSLKLLLRFVKKLL